MRSLAISVLLLLAGDAIAPDAGFAVTRTQPLWAPEATADMVDAVSDPTVGKVLSDTIWIADWTFDGGAPCNDSGWVRYDNRILNDGSNYWVVDNRFAGTGGITGKAAILSRHSLTWPSDGYGNNWDYSVILKYKGTGSTLSFKYLSDSEPGFDFVTVEADSAGASEARVNYAVNPKATAEFFRPDLVAAVSGVVSNGSVAGLALPDFGVPATVHEVYVRFESDGDYSDESGNYPSFWHAGLVVDNIVVTGGLAYSENFEGALNANVTLANTMPATPFGEWARLFPHATDNDKCFEDATCAWLWSDPTRLAFFPDRAFGPGGAVIRNWLDDVIVSPWVSLASTPTAGGTSLRFRRFSGQLYSQSRIAQNYSVRAKVRIDNTDTSAPGDSINIISPWGHASTWTMQNTFAWGDVIDGGTQLPIDLTPDFDPRASEIQVSFRVSDWQYIAGATAPATLNPGPGPYIDRVRIGRRIVTGPIIDPGIDTRSQAQDAFPTVQNGILPGQHFSPDGANRFGSCAFSCGTDLTNHTVAALNVITGDSISLNNVVDARQVGGIASVRWYGAIVSGPHAGKAPFPYTVGGNGFFTVTPDSGRGNSGSIILGCWTLDFDDTYFRGGDQLLYFWAATDVGGGFASYPPGMGAAPGSVAAAEAASHGLLEVSYLPMVNWAPAYLARLAADAHGDLDPTPDELAASTQANCLLYNQRVTSSRRSGETQRTAFMYTLDRLGYRGHYDVYDQQGGGSSNNHLGGRANVAQASGYALVIQDDGRSPLFPNIPDGTDFQGKVNQALWYRNYLAQGAGGLVGTASLWVIGENTAIENPTLPLWTTDFGLTGIVTDQGLAVNPEIEGVASFTWANGGSTDFTGDAFGVANFTCAPTHTYDAANATGTAVRTHSYKFGATLGLGAIVMNHNAVLQWNTIWMGFPWFDMRGTGGVTPSSPDEEERLADAVLSQTLPVGCQHVPDPTTGTDPDGTDALPKVSSLAQNVPNPFNPTTTIAFDLAQAGHVRLTVFDVAGRVVRRLANSRFEAGRAIPVVWNGLDDAGNRVPSGIYFYQLVTTDFSATRKMVILK